MEQWVTLIMVVLALAVQTTLANLYQVVATQTTTALTVQSVLKKQGEVSVWNYQEAQVDLILTQLNVVVVMIAPADQNVIVPTKYVSNDSLPNLAHSSLNTARQAQPVK